MSDIAQAIVAVGMMACVAFLCWVFHSMEPLWLLFVLLWMAVL